MDKPRLSPATAWGRWVAIVVVGACALAAPIRAADSGGPAYLTVQRIVEDKRIIDVHEHVEGEESAEVLLGEMDALGIGKTILLGSPWFTISLYEKAGFTRYDENNAAIVAMANAHPDRFEAWPTVNPLDPDKLEKIKALVAQGASGVKLYLGHGYTTARGNQYIFHTIAMDDPLLFPLYAYLAAGHLPVCFHVNPAKPGFLDEFVQVLTRYPNLKVNTPHYMLSSMAQSRLREMMLTFPNLYVDISFGHDDYLETGLDRIASDPASFRRLFEEFPERFFFGTDYVVTALRPHDHEWYRVRTRAYLDMLSRSEYTTPLVPGRTLRGLALPANLLEDILYRNYERFQALKPENTAITRELQWLQMRIRPVRRNPGEALPPPSRRR